MPSLNKTLKDQIKELPVRPGVYYFLDESGSILYVGKAKNLKNRLRQYFLKELGRGPAIEQMVRLAADIKWIETESEIEAILLEAEQISKLKPKYNVRQKDDKSFLVIRITKKESSKSKFLISNQIPNPKIQNPKDPGSRAAGRDDSIAFPCVELVRFRNVDFADKSAEYFGPYPSGDLLKQSLRYLRKVFPYRDCSKTKFSTYQKKGRPCTYGDIRVCTGPCAGWVDEKTYERNVRYLKDFLRGKKSRIIRVLEKEMFSLSKKKKYEEAANIRNQFRALQHLNDVAVGVRDDFFESAPILFKRIECYDISNILDQYAVGSMIVFTDGKADKAEYRKFRIQNSNHVISTPFDKLRAGSAEKSHMRKDPHTLLAPHLTSPRGGEEPLAMAQDDNEKKPNNDLSRLEQILTRRFKNDWPRPDLIIIDGGNNQLEVARRVLKRYNLNIPAISISKGPERLKNDFHFSDFAAAKYFKGNEPLENIAIMARDESHRFAISYYRTLHRKGIYK